MRSSSTVRYPLNYTLGITRVCRYAHLMCMVIRTVKGDLTIVHHEQPSSIVTHGLTPLVVVPIGRY